MTVGFYPMGATALCINHHRITAMSKEQEPARSPTQPERQARSWISQSRHHTDRVHQLNVKLCGESNALLREIATAENVRLYEVIEKALTFYHQHHHSKTAE